MNYNLFLDDIRVPLDAFNYMRDTRYSKLEWIIVRNYENFVKIIQNEGVPSLVSFDHDLADEHYGRDDMLWSVDGVIDYFSYKEKTGYECAKWLCDYCLDNNEKFPTIMVHSFNNIGAANIRSYVRNFLKHNPELV
jgi:hypothetical protein